VRQRIVVQLQQPERRVGPHLRVRHTIIVVRATGPPTGSAELLACDAAAARVFERRASLIR
jgi:hypothetical protein